MGRCLLQGFVAGFVLLVASVANADDLYTQSDSWAYAEPVSAYQFHKGWNDHLHDGKDDASALFRFESGISKGKNRFGLVYQQLYLVDANADATRLYHRARNKLPFTPGERFDFEVHGLISKLLGMRFARVFEPAGWLTAELGTTIWYGLELFDGVTRGDATAVGEKDYDFSAIVDYSYSRRDPIFKDRKPRPNSNGLGFDVGLRGRFSDSWSANLHLYDLYSWIDWDNAHFTTGAGDASNKIFGPDGYAHFNPTFSGLQGKRDDHQRIPPHGQFALRWDTGAGITGLRVRGNDLHKMGSLFWDMPLRANDRVEYEFIVHANALGIQWNHADQFKLRMASDSFNYQKAHFLQFEVALGLGL